MASKHVSITNPAAINLKYVNHIPISKFSECHSTKSDYYHEILKTESQLVLDNSQFDKLQEKKPFNSRLCRPKLQL